MDALRELLTIESTDPTVAVRITDLRSSEVPGRVLVEVELSGEHLSHPPYQQHPAHAADREGVAADPYQGGDVATCNAGLLSQ